MKQFNAAPNGQDMTNHAYLISPGKFEWIFLGHGAVREQTITWANVDPDLCRRMASKGHNELIW